MRYMKWCQVAMISILWFKNDAEIPDVRCLE